jgi:hypothetical protein
VLHGGTKDSVNFLLCARKEGVREEEEEEESLFKADAVNEGGRERESERTRE